MLEELQKKSAVTGRQAYTALRNAAQKLGMRLTD